MSKPLLTHKDLARETGLSVRTIKKAARKRLLPFRVEVNHRVILYKAACLRVFGIEK